MARRAFTAAVSLWLALSLAFAVVHLAPGDPVAMLVGDEAPPEEYAALRESLGLNASLPSQYGRFIMRSIRLDFGTSFRQPDQSVRELLFEALPTTLGVALLSAGMAWLMGVSFGLLASRHAGRTVDRALSWLASIGLAVPNVVLGPLAILLFGVVWRIVPMPGQTDGVARFMLPVVVLGTSLSSSIFRQMRASALATRGLPHVTAARARGVSEWYIDMRHVLPVCIAPVLTVAAAQLAALLSGAVVIEVIFQLPGLGTLFLDAFYARDYPLIEGCLFVSVLVYVLINTMLELGYQAFDPRSMHEAV